MRMILFFDLPSVTKKDHKEYQKFIKLIKSKGFVMLQESVYTKLAITPSVVDSVMIELKKKVPVEGSISLLTITEKQFSSMKQLLGEIETDVIMSEDKVIKL